MVQGLQSSINRCPPAPSGMNSMQCMCNVHVHVHSRSCACACGVHVHVHVHVHVCACASGCLQNFSSQFQGFQGPIALFFRVPIFTTALSISDRCEFSLLMNMTKMNNQCDDKAIFRVVRVPMKKRQYSGFSGSHLLISGFSGSHIHPVHDHVHVCACACLCACAYVHMCMCECVHSGMDQWWIISLMFDQL